MSLTSCGLYKYYNTAEEDAKLDAYVNSVKNYAHSEARAQQSSDPNVRAAALQRATARDRQTAELQRSNAAYAAQQAAENQNFHNQLHQQQQEHQQQQIQAADYARQQEKIARDARVFR